MNAMNLPPALLEDWMRQYYFDTRIDIGSSGVEDYSLAELSRILGFGWEHLQEIVFHDSQTLGGPRLRQAIADRWADGDARCAMATHGSSEANFLIMNALLKPGDEVVVTDICYPQLYLIAESLACSLRKWPLRFERQFRPDLDELRSLISPATRMVVVNFPNNPTGATITPEERDALVEACAEVGAYLVWDDAFGDLTYDRPPLTHSVGLYDRLLLMGTLSKAYGLPGLRVGWCAAAPEILGRMIRLRDYMTLHLSPLVEMIASYAIEQAERLIAPRLEQCRRNRERLIRWCEERPESIALAPPQGGACAFPRLLGVSDVEAFCHRLAREQKVLLVPGSCFSQPQHVRLGFGGRTADFQDGLDRLGRQLDGERARAGGVGAGTVTSMV